MMQMPMNSYGNLNIGNIDPSLGMDLGYTMGDGMEQAMGMAIGVGPFGEYYSDEAFYGVMDSMGGPVFEGM
jgi:hypothetical protein